MSDVTPVRIEGWQIESLDGEVILLHATRNVLVYANQTAMLILQLCDGVRTVEEIVALLSAAYPDGQDEIANDVPQTIQALVEQGVLTA